MAGELMLPADGSRDGAVAVGPEHAQDFAARTVATDGVLLAAVDPGGVPAMRTPCRSVPTPPSPENVMAEIIEVVRGVRTLPDLPAATVIAHQATAGRDRAQHEERDERDGHFDQRSDRRQNRQADEEGTDIELHVHHMHSRISRRRPPETAPQLSRMFYVGLPVRD